MRNRENATPFSESRLSKTRYYDVTKTQFRKVLQGCNLQGMRRDKRIHHIATARSFTILPLQEKDAPYCLCKKLKKPRRNGSKMTSFRGAMAKLGAGVDNKLGGSAPHQCR